MAGTMAGPALGIGAAAAAGGAAAGGIGGLLAGAAPAALGAGIATLAAGGDPQEALMNAALGGAGSVAAPALTGALQGLGGAAAQKAAVQSVKGGAQAATAAAPATSLRPMMRPDNLMAAAGPAGATPTSAVGGPGFMDTLKQASQLSSLMPSGKQEQRAPMPAPQTTGGGGTPMQQSGGPFGSILGGQQAPTPTAASYTGGAGLNFAGGTGMNMPMMMPQRQQPDYMTSGLGTMRGFV